MPLNINNQIIKDVYLGNTKIREAYLGNILVYSSSKNTYQSAIKSTGYIYTTEDNWKTNVQRTNVGRRNWVDIDGVRGNHLIQSAIVNGTSGLRYIYTTNDGWNTFQERVNVGSRNWQQICICDSNPLVQTAVTENDRIYTTNDGWNTFIQRINPPSTRWRGICIDYDNPNHQTAIAFQGYIYETFDGWNTIIQKTNVPANNWSYLSYSKRNFNYQTAAGDFNTIYTTDNCWSTFRTIVVGNSNWRGIAICDQSPLNQIAMSYAYGQVLITNDGWISSRLVMNNNQLYPYRGDICYFDPKIQSIGQTATNGVIYTTENSFDLYTSNIISTTDSGNVNKVIIL